MTRGLRNEAAVRRLFREHGFEVVSIRRGKHWVVRARRAGSEAVTMFTLSASPSDSGIHRVLGGNFKRAAQAAGG
jgi:hypothetical protein